MTYSQLFIQGTTDPADGGQFQGKLDLVNVSAGTQRVFVGTPQSAFPEMVNMTNCDYRDIEFKLH